jgi:O-antigen ligase
VSQPINRHDPGVATGSALIALLAAGVPVLLAYNLQPSATLFNQAAAFVGWAAFALIAVMGSARPSDVTTRALLSVCFALVAVAVMAILGLERHESLALSMLGTLAAVAVMLGAGAAVRRNGRATTMAGAVCVGLLGVAVISTGVSLMQVFAPSAIDGVWIAASSLPGRAVGNLRQPNHLSSLLLWALIAAAALRQGRSLSAAQAIALAGLISFGIVLTASRTGAAGVLVLASWGALDRRLDRGVRAMLIALLLMYVAGWLAMSAWAGHQDQVFGGQARIADGALATTRWAIWSDALTLIARNPWLGVGVGELNFAWTLTPFANRSGEFFDHTHNLPLQLLVELGIPLGTLVTAVLAWALWRAFVASREASGAEGTALRAAFMMLLIMALHSMLEYPLWYAYFLLPTAFLLGLCLGRAPDATPTVEPPPPRPRKTRPLVVAGLLMMLGGFATVLDYLTVVPIFEPPVHAAPLAERIARGQRSILFAHHADYAAATTAARPADQLDAIERAAHHLLDARLMMAWARALHDTGDIERARHVAARLREFRHPQAAAFFAECDKAPASGAQPPFQCLPPTVAFDWRDFRRDRRERP